MSTPVEFCKRGNISPCQCPADRQSLYKRMEFGEGGTFELEITVGADKLPDLESDSIRDAAYKAADLVREAVLTDMMKADPRAQQRAASQREELLSLFPEPIFVEEIPNGYCSQWCCKHLPWFSVTTRVGRFQIGWRKRVIHLEWTETRGTKTAKELFPDEDVTKEGRTIHAWGYEPAARYIARILETAV